MHEFIDSDLLLPRAHPQKLLTLFDRWFNYGGFYSAKYIQLTTEGFTISDSSTTWFEYAPTTIQTYLIDQPDWATHWTDGWLAEAPEGYPYSLAAIRNWREPEGAPTWQEAWINYKHSTDYWMFVSLVIARMYQLQTAMNLEILMGLDIRGRPRVPVDIP